MGAFEKLAFWKKKDEFNFNDSNNPGFPPGNMASPNFNNPGMGQLNDPMSMPNDPLAPQDFSNPGMEVSNPSLMLQPQSMNQPMYPNSQFSQPGFSQNQQQNYIQPVQPQNLNSSQKDFDLIFAKLDALKAAIDTLNMRIENIERIAMHGEEKERIRPRW